MNTLILKTFYLHETLNDDQIDKYNSSNGIIISKHIFEQFLNESDKTCIIGLYNTLDNDIKKIYVNVIDSHDTEDNIAYVPQWIYEYLNYIEDSNVTYMRVYPKVGNKVKIKPKGDFYAYLDDPVTALRDGFEEYTCLLKDTVIIININGIPLEVEILETYVNDEICNNQPIYIRGVELEVDIESTEDVDIKSTNNLYQPNQNLTEEIDFDSMLPNSFLPTNLTNKFPGKGHKLN